MCSDTVIPSNGFRRSQRRERMGGRLEIIGGDGDGDFFDIVAIDDSSVVVGIWDEDAAGIGGICVDCGREDGRLFVG